MTLRAVVSPGQSLVLRLAWRNHCLQSSSDKNRGPWKRQKLTMVKRWEVKYHLNFVTEARENGFLNY